MNKKQTLKLTVPFLAKKQLHECLIINPPTFKYERENFYWLIDSIISFVSINDIKKLKEGKYVPISSKYMDKHIPNGQYAKYMKYMEEIGIIECDHKFSKELEICKGYMITDKYLSNIDIEKDKVFINDSANIWHTVEALRIEKHSHKAMTPEFKALKKYFNNIKFDYAGARQHVQNMTIKGKNKDLKRRSYLKCLDNLEDKKKRYFHISPSNGRLNSNYTNMLKELRQFIQGDMIIIDLSNSQPYFLSEIFKSIMSYCSSNSTFYTLKHRVFIGLSDRFKNSPIVCPIEVADFSNRCRNGSLYEHFTNQMGLGFKREKVKKKILAMLYSSNDSYFYYAYEQIFKNLYPSLHKLVRHLKLVDHAELSLTMQRVESDVFIEGIARKLVELGIGVITIHDSIIIDRYNYSIALKVMKDVFNTRFGNLPHFKTTNLDGSEAFITEEPEDIRA